MPGYFQPQSGLIRYGHDPILQNKAPGYHIPRQVQAPIQIDELRMGKRERRMEGGGDADDTLVITSPHQIDGMRKGSTRYLLRLADTATLHQLDIEIAAGSRRG